MLRASPRFLLRTIPFISLAMPMDTSQYMLAQGWAGAGVPLDGHGGNGLKKPLAIPQKRGMKGLGKDRDRAVEWWDCLFEVSAV